MIDFPHMTATEAKEYPELWETTKALLSLDDEQTAMMVSLVVGVCPHCYEASSGPSANSMRGCQCWNDE